MAKSIGNSVAKPTHQQIAERARAIYEHKGKVPGQDLENWLEAEAQLMSAQSGSKEQKPELRANAKVASHQ
jgi:hypothetical protein